ncbi:MAG: hypothetical protein HY662_01130 [Chloroflexi bacterium]|nr:hypothetical protein [Chloroflexota bacterium]
MPESIQESEERHIKEEMKEGYIAMAEENRRTTEEFLEVQREALPEWNANAGNS